MNPALDQLRRLYEDGDAVRCSFSDRERAAPIYERYVAFVAHHAVPGAALLDVGCGTGWSSYFFAEKGFATTGVDLNPKAFETPALPNLVLRVGSAVELPFGNEEFDIVAAHQTLEHIPQPTVMLQEMVRVLRPGGVVCIVGPNLISIGNCLRAGLHACKNRPWQRVLWRGAGMPRHPFGNTVPEALAQLMVTGARIVRKSFERDPRFLMREPDLVPPFHGDNDAVYLCNPLDVSKYFRKQGCHVLRSAALGRPRFTRMLAGGTWVAARKAT
jgi:SAM-dependent methyltransferase